MATESMPDDVVELKKMITDLRKEAASHRVKAKPYLAAFDGYNEKEVAYLLELVDAVATDPEAGAAGFRDLAKDIMKDKFYDGLDDVPGAAPAEDKEEETEVSLTREELVAILDERDGKATASREEQQKHADAEAIFKEIEAAGFERDTPEFMAALQVGNFEVNLGNDVDFKALAPRIYAAAGVEAPTGETVDGDPEASKDGPKTPETVDVEGVGSATETVTGVVEEAKDKGLTPLDVARARLEARLG